MENKGGEEIPVAVLGDLHFGMRSDSIHFYDFFSRFYKEVFFPYLLQYNIRTVIQTGDLFDRRKYINFHILQRAKRDFFDWLLINNIDFYTYIGNHDAYWRNTLEVNSINLLLKEYKNIHVYTDPATLMVQGIPVDIIPWICSDNEKQIMDFINNSKSQLCFGHFELNGFEMDRGNVCHDGMDRDTLKKYDMVISGHFHHKSSDGHIFYVGTPGEMTFADAGDPKGFHIFDATKRSLEFIPNPFKMFHRIKYDDKNGFDFEYLKSQDWSMYKGTYVKIVVVNKSNPHLFELFMSTLYNVAPLDITIVEDSTISSTMEDDDGMSQAEDTPTLLRRYIDGIESLDVDKDILYNKLHEIYIESQNLEQV